MKSLAWPTQGLRRASVNSFGFGGSNAHVVLDDAYHYLESRSMVGKHQTTHGPSTSLSMSSGNCDLVERFDAGDDTIIDEHKQDIMTPRLFVWSAADEQGIKRLSELYKDYFRNAPDADISGSIQDLAYTLAAKRTSFTWRSFMVASDLTSLRALDSNISQAVRSSDKRSITFVFTGQGAQYARMGLELLQYPVFKESLQETQTVLSHIGCEWQLLGCLLLLFS